MMRLKVEVVGEGLHPSETVVSVKTIGGVESVVVSTRSIQDKTILVGWPVGARDQTALVELPRETASGAWRIWVPSDQLVEVEERMQA